MTTHSLHEDSHTHGLADDCLRCQEHLERPDLTLDRRNIARLLRGHIYTATDRAAAALLKDAISTGQRLIAIHDEEPRDPGKGTRP